MFTCPQHPDVVLRETRAGPVCFLCESVVEPIEVKEPAHKLLAFRPRPPPHRLPPAPKREGTFDDPIPPSDEEEIQACRDGLIADPTNPVLTARIGRLLGRNGETFEAASWFLKLAEALAGQKHFLRAVTIYQYALRLDPSHSEAHLPLAEAYRRLGLEQASQRTLATLWAAQRARGHLADAYETLRLLLDVHPRFVPQDTRVRETWDHSLQVLPLVPTTTPVVVPLQRIRPMDTYLRELERAVSLGTVTSDDVATWSTLHLQGLAAPAAIAELERKLEINPRRPALRMMLASCLELAQDRERAQAEYLALAAECQAADDLDNAEFFREHAEQLRER